MARGRPRKPVRLKVLDGTFRADRHAGELNQVAGSPVFTEPKNLGPRGLALWHEVVRVFGGAGCIDSLDALGLEATCRLGDHYFAALEACDLPAIKVLGPRFESLLARYGLTPADRARVQVREQKASGGISDFARLRRV